MAVTFKTLRDLYEIGREVDILDPKNPENPVKVYVRKLTPTQSEVAMRKASAARAMRGRVMEFPDDNEEKILLFERVEDMGGVEEWIGHLVARDIFDIRAKIEQELSEEEEWAQEGYLQSLYDAWNDGLLKEFAEKDESERSEECTRVWNELRRFADQIEAAVEPARAKLVREYESEPAIVLRNKVAESLLSADKQVEWLRVYRLHQMLFGVQTPDTKEQVFSSIEEVDDLPIEVFRSLIQAVSDISLNVQDVKS